MWEVTWRVASTEIAMSFINKIRIRTKLLLILILTAVALAAAIGAATSILHQRMLQDRIAKLRAVVEVVHEHAQALATQVKAGKLTEDEAMARLKDDGHAMWFDDHRSAVWIGGLDGVWFMSASFPKLEGSRGTRMPDGRYILEDFIASVKDHDEGLSMFDYP